MFKLKYLNENQSIFAHKYLASRGLLIVNIGEILFIALAVNEVWVCDILK